METDALNKFPALTAVLQAYADEVRELYKANLIKSDALATEELLNSVQTQVVTDNVAFLVTMTLADYWKFVEFDTKPHWPPPEAMLKWVTVKPVIPRPDKKGRLPKPKQLAFLIGRKIAEKGTTGKHDLGDAVTNCNRKYEPLLSEALAQDLGQNFNAWIVEMLDFRR